MESLLALLLLVVGFCFLYISKFIYGDYLSPIGIFGFVQSASLGLFHLKLLPYNPLSKITWICVIVGFACFVFGCIIVNLFTASLQLKSSIEDSFNESRVFKVIVISFILGVVGFTSLVYLMLKQYDLNTLIQNQNMVRENFRIRFITYPWFFNVLTPSLIVLYWKIAKRHKVILSCLFLGSIIMLALSFSRSLAIMALVMAFLSANYLKVVRKPLKSGLAIAFVIIIAFSSLHAMRKSSYIQLTYNQSTSISIHDAGYWMPVYGYFTNGLSIFEKFANDTKKFDHGTNTFVTFYKVLNFLGSNFDVPGIHGKWYANPVRGNVYTYLGVYYKDFGVPGVIVFSFFQGILVMIPYLLMSKHNKQYLFLLNSVFGFCLLISFFSNHFRGNTTLFLVLITLIIGNYIKNTKVAS